MDADKNTAVGVRLQVYLAHCGVASRRACETYIAAGRVSVNGSIVTVPGTKVCDGDVVCVDGQAVHVEQHKRYVLLYKPSGYVCSLADEKGRATAADIVRKRYTERLYNIGRLDMYSEGLIIFTNDGDFAAAIGHPSAELEKEYIIETTNPIPDVLLERFCKGIRIDSVFYRCRSAVRLGSRKVRIVLIEGKNREIRRVFDYFAVGIRRLTRVRIGCVRMGDLRSGDCRELSEREVQGLLHDTARDDGY